MFRLFKKSKEKSTFVSPADGILISIDEVPDDSFAQKLMGDGFGIIPSNGTIYSPVNGEVTLVFPTGHAFGIHSDEGLDILIHLGIDTVTLEGTGFHTAVSQGQRIKQGDKLTDMDLDIIRQHNLPDTCIVLFPNGEQVNSVKKGKVQHGEASIITLQK